MKIPTALFFLTISFSKIYCQETDYLKKDSLKTDIEQVVLTAQYGTGPLKKSLHKIEVISKEDIARLSANSVAEVLNQSLNILIIPEKNSGNSKANILGMGADYTKILIDNIPLIGDEGLGSNIDLTKINLDNVERIEIVKGSMGVEFGTNAVAGVINIITKKSDSRRWNVRGFVQEETVGKEYNWIDYGKGKHVQSLGISHNFNPKWFANLSINRNDFQGFWGGQQGKNYFLRDHRRGYEWQPKEQLNPSASLRFHSGSTQVFYKADFLSEKVNFYNPTVEPLSLGNGARTYTAIDKDYNTERWLHHLGLNTKFFDKTLLTADFSWQKQSRKSVEKLYDIPARSMLSSEPENLYYQSETFYSRGTVSGFLNQEKVDVQLGYEADYTRGFAGWNTGSFGGKNVAKDIFTGGIFGSAEFKLNENWFLRPGIRYSFSNVFRTAPNFSLVLKNKFSSRSDFRITMGTSNRNPSFEELYAYFVDSNHDIRGNESLEPESSYTGALSYTLSSSPGSMMKWSLDLSTMYLQVGNRISVSAVNTAPLQYRYINVDTFENWVSSFAAKIRAGSFTANAGVAVGARAFGLESGTDSNFKFYAETNASLFYEVPNTKTSLAVYYKGVGRSTDLTEDKTLGITQYLLAERKGFSMLDASVSQIFFKKYLTLTVGIRNILDVTSVQTGETTGGAHQSDSSPQMLFYGRSYFTRLNFNF